MNKNREAKESQAATKEGVGVVGSENEKERKSDRERDRETKR